MVFDFIKIYIIYFFIYWYSETFETNNIYDMLTELRTSKKEIDFKIKNTRLCPIKSNFNCNRPDHMKYENKEVNGIETWLFIWESRRKLDADAGLML